ncbi:hypothetical protein [Yinghuangia soli]|uniref:Uncharacterized protein n=1 Tax=Yinghuangia soli TaxID=2908204 RepID=A0AA41TXZ8_9ACTN|nr:hypothetical protein [Yinghuangia soli]MCF2525615.1 hypothetical protein [Yinghuangia soli]
MSPSSAPLRVLRAGLFAAVGVVLSVGGHVVASGASVPGWAVAVAAAVGFGVGWSGAGRECGLLRMLVAVVGGQVLLHEWFGWAAAQGASAGHSGHADHTGHVAGGVAAHGGVAMAAAHLAVALVAAVWLRVGEAAVFRLLARVEDRLRAGVLALLRLLVRPVPGSGPAVVAAGGSVPAPGSRLRTRYDVVRRGPPVWCASRMIALP